MASTYETAQGYEDADERGGVVAMTDVLFGFITSGGSVLQGS